MAFVPPAPGGAAPQLTASAVVNQAVTSTLSRQDVPIKQEDVAEASSKTTNAVMSAIDQSGSAVVPVQSPYASKVNITAAVTALIGLAVAFGAPISESEKAAILTVVSVVGPAVIVIFKTFFSRSITPQSKNAP